MTIGTLIETPKRIAIPSTSSFSPAAFAHDVTAQAGREQSARSGRAQNHDLVLIDASAEVVALMSQCKAFDQVGTIVVADRSSSNEHQQQLAANTESAAGRTIGVIENFAA